MTGSDKWAEQLQANTEATQRWMRRMLRAATELRKLLQERKRLLNPKRGKLKVRRPGGLAEVPRMAAGGDDFNDEVPI